MGGAGVGSIPFESADRYAERHGIEDFDEFWSLIRAMDREYISHYSERNRT